MRKFDTKVQHLKYTVLREVARQAWDGTLLQNITEIPKKLIPGTEATMRCCVYKERAILSERIKLAMGGNRDNPNVIEVMDIACDECPVGGYEITDACRGCIAHRCEEVCKKGAITFDHHQKAHIDKAKCIECGQCAKVCPYSAIANNKRPCQRSCKLKAISINHTKAVSIDNSKCISCGACVYQCPFGAIMDKSFILNVVELLKGSCNNQNYKTYAIIAPSIASQFTYAKLGQIITGMKLLGFYDVVEVALGADMVACAESAELIEKGFLTSSCCPAFVSYIKNQFPDMALHISHNPSPMAMLAKVLKASDPSAKIVFVGPCTAKKMEFQREDVRPYVDSVITFEELQALFDARALDLTALDEAPLCDASYYGRIFARSGGLSEAVMQAVSLHEGTDFHCTPVVCDGIEACKTALLKASKNVLNGNFIEGMACSGGCIGGAGCLTHGDRNRSELDKHCKEAKEKTMAETTAAFCR